jgi:xanthine dehydrogenase accessory factor
MTPETITALNLALRERRPVAFAKNLQSGAEFLLPNADVPLDLNEVGLSVLAADKTGTHLVAGEDWFIEARNPAPRLILVGAVHIAQALVPLAQMLSFEVLIVDPRRAFGNEDRFPSAIMLNEWPDIALARMRPDVRTAIVTLTHDPKLDDPALDQALKTDAFYIGALGSRKTHSSRIERLSNLGHSPDSLRRIRGPVGLDIAAITTPEIALSVIAEIVAVRRGGAASIRTT